MLYLMRTYGLYDVTVHSKYCGPRPFILRHFLQASTSTSNFVGSLPLLLLFGVKRQVMSNDQYYQVS